MMLSLAITTAQLTPFHVPRLTPIGIALLSGLAASALRNRNTDTWPEPVTANGCVYAAFFRSVPENVSVCTVGGVLGPVGVERLLLLLHADATIAAATASSARQNNRRIESKLLRFRIRTSNQPQT